MPGSTYPERKLTIVGGGIIGFLEAYLAYVDAKKRGERVRITVHDKNETIADTTTSHLVPSLTPDEILSVVPRGQALIEKLTYLFNVAGGIRVDDVAGVNDTEVAEVFKRAVQAYGSDEDGHRERTATLLALGKMSMDLWQAIYDHADAEFREILRASNFNPCHEPTSAQRRKLHDGYRIDLIQKVPGAEHKVKGMITDYSQLGYQDCRSLSPDEVIQLDPFLQDFCLANSHLDAEGKRCWKGDAAAIWRPGGCIDTKTFLPLAYEYLHRMMGTYINETGVEKNCFRFKLDHQVTGVEYQEGASASAIQGLSIFSKRTNETKVKCNKHIYNASAYVFCPGERVGTLKELGFNEPPYARFAGASLMLSIDVPEELREKYSTFNHCMEVHQEGVVLAWQARFVDNKISIGVAGTKAFYADKEPKKNEQFAEDRNLLQLNIINNVLPEFISLALGRDTEGVELTQDDMRKLEESGIATRWVGSRAVAHDGFPTVGPVYREGQEVSNARCTTHLGSGGVSFGPAAVMASLFAKRQTGEGDKALLEKVATFGNAMRI